MNNPLAESPAAQAESKVKCPYVGLVPFTAADAPFFFGRDNETEIITANLQASRLTLLYGVSGVGKSSVLRAAVEPQLRKQAEENRVLYGRPEMAVVEYSNWCCDPMIGLNQALAEAVQISLGQPVVGASGVEPWTPDQPVSQPATPSLADLLQHYSALLDGDLLIILDQFEEFFRYHGHDDGPGTFAYEFPRAVNRADLRVSFLIAIREDALAKLDAFKGRIPNLFDNYLWIEHLDRDAARQAIEKPLEKFNATLAEADRGKQVDLDPTLIDAVLDQVQTGQTRIGAVGRGGVESEPAEGRRIEAPYLQLVLTRLWDEEHQAGSHRLRSETLKRLGGAKQIVRTHLDLVMQRFEDDQRRIVARVFDRLVTPSGTKIAMSAADLATLAHVSAEQLRPVLEQLAGPKVRILRAVPPPLDQPDQPRFEIFLDSLTKAALDWCDGFNQNEKNEADKKKLKETLRTKFLFCTLALVIIYGLIVTIVVSWPVGFFDDYAASRVHPINEVEESQSRKSIQLVYEYQQSEKSPIRDSARNRIGNWSSRLSTPFLHDGTVTSVAFTSDGLLLATGCFDKSAWL